MIDWKLIGDLFICLSIILGGFTFAYANGNYLPGCENCDEEDKDAKG